MCLAAAAPRQPQRELRIGLSWLVIALSEARQRSFTVFSGLFPCLLPDKSLRDAQHGLSIAADAFYQLELASGREKGVGGCFQFAACEAGLRQSQQAFCGQQWLLLRLGVVARLAETGLGLGEIPQRQPPFPLNERGQGEGL